MNSAQTINGIKIIAFDADDTLWANENHFRDREAAFCDLLEGYMARHSIMQELYKTEIENIKCYGYGMKGFTLSMVETLITVTGGQASLRLVEKVIALGKTMLEEPVILLDGVTEVLNAVRGGYKLVLATKGDLLEQKRKLVKSGLEKYFHHIEIMSNKEKADYQKLLSRLGCRPSEFLMIGNSVKSDVLPVLKAGARAIHVPYHTTWIHEQVDKNTHDHEYLEVNGIANILGFIP